MSDLQQNTIQCETLIAKHLRVPSSALPGITLSGDVTGTGSGTIATTYNNAVPITKGGTGRTTFDFDYGSYVPAVTIPGSTGTLDLTQCRFMRVGSIVTMSGVVSGFSQLAGQVFVNISPPAAYPIVKDVGPATGLGVLLGTARLYGGVGSSSFDGMIASSPTNLNIGVTVNTPTPNCLFSFLVTYQTTA